MRGRYHTVMRIKETMFGVIAIKVVGTLRVPSAITAHGVCLLL